MLSVRIQGDDVKRALLWGVSGFIGGSAYSIVYALCKRYFDVVDTRYNTEAVYSDAELYAMFCKLHTHANIDEGEFQQAVAYSDRLLYREQQLSNGVITPCLRDRPESFVLFKEALASLEKVVSRSNALNDAKTHVHIHMLYERIYTSLQSHWHSILKLTRNIKE